MEAVPVACSVTVRMAVPDPFENVSILTELGLTVTIFGSIDVTFTTVLILSDAVSVCGMGTVKVTDDGTTGAVASAPPI